MDTVAINFSDTTKRTKVCSSRIQQRVQQIKLAYTSQLLSKHYVFAYCIVHFINYTYLQFIKADTRHQIERSTGYVALLHRIIQLTNTFLVSVQFSAQVLQKKLMLLFH